MKKSKSANHESISLEMEVLLLSCLTNFNLQKQERIHQILKSDFNWDQLFILASNHRVFPLVYKNLSSSNIIIIPQDISKRFNTLYKTSVLTSMHMAGELSRVFSIFRDGELRALAIKGPALAKYVYGEIGLRAASGDLDILVDVADLEKAEHLLTTAGYVKDFHGFQLSPKQNEMQLRNNHHHLFIHPNKIAIELHWRLHENFSLQPFRDLWVKHETVELARTSVYIPALEDYLIYLMFHASRHGFPQLKWLCDIAELIHKNYIDWKSLEVIAKEYHLLHVVGQTLCLMRELFGYEGPLEAQRISSDALGIRLSRMVIPFIFTLEPGAIAPGGSLYLAFKYYSWKWQSSGVEKIKYRTSLLYPTIMEYSTIKIPDRYYFLYYILRPILLLYRGIRRKKNNESR